MNPSPAKQRVASVLLGAVFLLVVPGTLLGPVLFDAVPLDALPGWAAPSSMASAVLGLWHLVTAVYALDEDLAMVTLYVQAQDAAPLVLPFSLFVGTRSVYRRLFAPAYVARRRWQASRDARAPMRPHAPVGVEPFADTIPRES